MKGARVAAATLALAATAVSCRGGGVWDPRLPTAAPRVFAVDNYPDRSGRYWVSVVDPRANRVVRAFRVGPRPHHIYAIPRTNRAYVTHFVGHTIEVVDLRRDRVVGHVRATGTGPRHLLVGADGRHAYTDDFDGNTVTVIDTRSDEVVAKIPVGRNPNYSIESHDGRRLYQANAGDNRLSVIDTAARRVVAEVTVGKGPFDVAMSPDGSTLVAADATSNTASVIDATTLAVRAEIPIGGHIDTTVEQRLNVRISDDGRYAWIGNQAAAAFSVVDLASDSLAGILPTDKGADILYQFRGGPQAGWGVTTARYGSSVAVVRPSDPATAPRPITTAEGTHNLSRTPDNSRIYVSDRIGNAVSVIDLATLKEVARVPVGQFPDGIAYVWFDRGVARTDAEADPSRVRPS